MSITVQEMRDLLAGYPAQVLVGNWVVGAVADAGATSVTVVIADTRTASSNGTTPLVGASDTADFTGARILFGRGVETPMNLLAPAPPSTGLSFGFSTTVSAVSTNTSVDPPVTTLTLNDPVPQALAIGDTFTIFRAIRVEVTAPENIADIGGQAVPGNPIGTRGSATPTTAMLAGGDDGTDLHGLKTDTSGRIEESNLYAASAVDGAAKPNGIIQVGGNDGTDAQALLQDTDGTLHTIPSKLGALTPVNSVLITQVAEAATTAFGSFTATATGNATILVIVSAAVNALLTGLGVTGDLNGGTALVANAWYTFQIPVVSGQTYSFQVSAEATVSLTVIYNTTAG